MIMSVSMGIAGCTGEYIATVPQEKVIVKPEPPYDGAVWIGTEYRWDGHHYIEVPGHWERHHGRWVTGHWKDTPHGYRWIHGHWRR